MHYECDCPSCEKSGLTTTEHGSSCCFYPRLNLNRKKTIMKAKESYCSPECDIRAFRLFKKEPRLESLLTMCELWNNYKSPLNDYKLKEILEKKIETLNSPDYTMGGMLLPNFFATKIQGDFYYGLKLISMGFHYNINDIQFIKKISYQIQTENNNYGGRRPENGRIQEILNKDVALTLKVVAEYVKQKTDMNLNFGNDNQNNNINQNNNNQDNKKQKLEEQ